MIGHGNGPQVGLLALQGAAYEKVETYPFDVLGAQTEGMIGYMIEQELGNLLPFERPFATLLTMIEVDPDDPAFQNPTKFIGPVYGKEEADRLAAEKGWVFKQDGDKWRRVVASPMPKRIFELRPIKWLLEHNAVVIAAGGGGIPTMYEKGKERTLTGVECVIDKDFASELLARELNADLFIMLTDADCVYVDWGKPTQKAIRSRLARRAGGDDVCGRLDGAQGGRRVPLRQGNREEGGDRCAGGSGRDHRGDDGDDHQRAGGGHCLQPVRHSGCHPATHPAPRDRQTRVSASPPARRSWWATWWVPVSTCPHPPSLLTASSPSCSGS